jgi:hypothetical protein
MMYLLGIDVYIYIIPVVSKIVVHSGVEYAKLLLCIIMYRHSLCEIAEQY